MRFCEREVLNAMGIALMMLQSHPLKMLLSQCRMKSSDFTVIFIMAMRQLLSYGLVLFSPLRNEAFLYRQSY